MTHPPSASPALRPCHFVASRLRRARATGWGGRRPPQNGEFYARRSGSGGRQTLLPCHHQPTLLTASGWCTFRVPDWYTFRMPPASAKISVFYICHIHFMRTFGATSDASAAYGGRRCSGFRFFVFQNLPLTIFYSDFSN